MSGSALVMTALLVHKSVEAKRGTVPQVHNFRERIDPLLKAMHDKMNVLFGRMTLWHVWILAHDAVVRFGKLFMLFLRRTHAVASIVVEKASRRRENLSKGGAASFYIKQIKDAKDTGNVNGEKKEIQG